MKLNFTVIRLLLGIIILNASHLSGQGDKNCLRPSLQKSAIVKSSSAFSINEIYSLLINSGEFDHDNKTYGNGFLFPSKIKKGLAYSSGLIWLGKQNNNLKGGGNIYSRSTISPGKILSEEWKPENPDLESIRVYRVKSDFKYSSFKNEIDNNEGTFQQIFNQYEKDWNEWPAKDGAPYSDINKNGIYEPAIDIPGVPGAHQTLWFVGNDIGDKGYSQWTENNRFGVEVQVTVWGYDSDGPLGRVIFRKYKLINKSITDIKETYVSIFSDPSIGSNDNYAGSDSTLGLAYCYNGNDFDREYGNTPPALGFVYLQGPVVDGKPNEYAFENGKKLVGKKNLSATSFIFFTCGGTDFQWPSSRLWDWYYYQQGINPITKQIFQIPNYFGSGSTKFAFSGDPIIGSGWLDGYAEYCGSRYLLLNAGPFEIASSDTQEVVFAEIVGVGNSRLQSVTRLKELTVQVQNLYNYFIAENKVNVTSRNMIVPPEIEISGTSTSIHLDWGKNTNLNSKIENSSIDGYTFQGYNVYQVYPDMTVKDNAVRLATFDLMDGIRNVNESYYTSSGNLTEKIEQFGTDSGLQREFVITKDHIADAKFIKGKTYKFAVSAYYVSIDLIASNDKNPLARKTIESPLNVVDFEFRNSEPGISYKDKVVVNSNDMNHNDLCKIYVQDPDLLTNHNYNITFSKTGESVTWNLYDKTLGVYKLQNQMILEESWSDFYEDALFSFVDGMMILVVNPHAGMLKDGKGIVEVQYGGVPLKPSEYDESGAPFFGNSVWDNPNYPGANNERDKYYLRGHNFSLNDFVYSNDYSDYEIRFTDEGSYGVFMDWKIFKIPFEIWDIGIGSTIDSKDDIKLIPYVGLVAPADGKVLSAKLNAEKNVKYSQNIRAYNPLTRNSSTADYDEFKSIVMLSGGEGAKYDTSKDKGVIKKNIGDWYGFAIASLVLVDADNDDKSPPPGTIIRINTKKKITESDYFEFNTSLYTNSSSSEVPTNYKLFQNYPNPFNPSTTIRYQVPKPSHVTLKIYDMLGREVATLVDEFKPAGNYNSQFTPGRAGSIPRLAQRSAERVNSQLTSGIYFYRLTAGEFHQTKKMIMLK